MAESVVVDKGSSFMDPFKGFLLTYFMPESCYDEFFLNFNLLDGELLPAEVKSKCVRGFGSGC